MATSARRLSPGMVIARQDRITVWALPRAFLVVLGMGFLFTFYDIFDINVSFIGSIILFFGFNGWVPMTYAWSAENFPTRGRVTGFGLVDGVGHVGGGIGLVAITT